MEVNLRLPQFEALFLNISPNSIKYVCILISAYVIGSNMGHSLWLFTLLVQKILPGLSDALYFATREATHFLE